MYRDRKQISSCLGDGVGVGRVSVQHGAGGRDCQRHEETFKGDEYGQYLHYSEGFVDA